MADYWKSQAKKFCDFCKCWIADNKPSIGFHESGKRHKENVAKRLSEISKSSTKSYKEELQVDREMKKMEEEAFKAYMKDLQENPDYTSKRILEETERRKKELEESVKQQKETAEELEHVKKEEQNIDDAVVSEKIWFEAKSEEGYTYYWNVNTSESKWEPPEDGYVSLEDQEKQQKENDLKNELKRRKKEDKSKLKKEQSNSAEEKEPNKKKRKKELHKKDEVLTVTAGPAPKPDPYGAWTTIMPKIEDPIDLQLPVQEYVAIKVPEFTEPEIKFKEKTISSLGEDESVYNNVKKEVEDSSGSFKKRKFRGNIRQKLDTE